MIGTTAGGEKKDLAFWQEQIGGQTWQEKEWGLKWSFWARNNLGPPIRTMGSNSEEKGARRRGNPSDHESTQQKKKSLWPTGVKRGNVPQTGNQRSVRQNPDLMGWKKILKWSKKTGENKTGATNGGLEIKNI